MAYPAQRFEGAFRRMGFDPLHETAQEVIGRENEAIEQALINAKTHGVLVIQPRIGDLITYDDTSNMMIIRGATVREDPSVPFGEIRFTYEEQA